jgi:hypothetical protein
MLKDPDKPREPASKRAERRWKNHDVATNFKANRAEAKAAPPEPEEPLLIKTEKPIAAFERKFLRDIRAMMEGHKLRNEEIQAALIYRQKRRLLLEKLRRAEANFAAREGAKNG